MPIIPKDFSPVKIARRLTLTNLLSSNTDSNPPKDQKDDGETGRSVGLLRSKTVSKLAPEGLRRRFTVSKPKAPEAPAPRPDVLSLATLPDDILFILLEAILPKCHSASEFLQITALSKSFRAVYMQYMRTFLPIIISTFIPEDFLRPALALTVFMQLDRRTMGISSARNALIQVSSASPNVSLQTMFRTYQQITALANECAGPYALEERLYGVTLYDGITPEMFWRRSFYAHFLSNYGLRIADDAKFVRELEAWLTVCTRIDRDRVAAQGAPYVKPIRSISKWVRVLMEGNENVQEVYYNRLQKYAADQDDEAIDLNIVKMIAESARLDVVYALFKYPQSHRTETLLVNWIGEFVAFGEMEDEFEDEEWFRPDMWPWSSRSFRRALRKMEEVE